jgi:hypothetical protein
MSDQLDPAARPPRRFHKRAVLWIVLVAVLAGAALVVSFTVGSDEPAAPVDHAAFYAEAAALRSLPGLTLEIGGDTTELESAVALLDRMAQAAPAVASELSRVSGALDEVIRAAGAQGDDPDALAQVGELLDQQMAEIEEPSQRVATYVERWCDQPPR